GPIGTHECTFGSVPESSRLELNTTAAAEPLIVPLSGSLVIDFGTPSFGDAYGTCELGELDPAVVPGIGVLCSGPGYPCFEATIACDGGAALDVDVVTEASAGSCVDYYSCENLCFGYCSGQGMFLVEAGCTGFCQYSASTCDTDADCPYYYGRCSGPDPVGT